MKKLYAKKAFTSKSSFKKILFTLVLIITCFNSYSQELVNFEARAGIIPPTQTIYNIKGDFAMIGNTNLTLVNYNETRANNSAMRYVDMDQDANTLNSSWAELNFPVENGSTPECSKILFAGLYWVGRADSGTDSNADGDNNPNTFIVNGKTLNKQKVKIKGPLESNYTEVEATDIFFPSNAYQNIFTAYVDITQYVIDNNGQGRYYIADMALREGTIDITGYSGGWGMVVVYENSKMKYRNVTVFDGHAFVDSGLNQNFNFEIDGFNAVQSGDVNIRLGLMASEGEIGFAGDYFEIEELNSGNYRRLANKRGSTTNFFDSTIDYGGVPGSRGPELVNNTGLDIVTYDIPNSDKSIIGNGQTKTSFNYGTTNDTFVIFNVTFSVDAYIPEVDGILTTTSTSVTPPLAPNESANYNIEIRNKGTEATNGTIITIPIPDNLKDIDPLDPSILEITSSVNNPLTTTNTPEYDESIGPNGSIIWDLETLPLPSDPETLLASISFKLTVTTDCSILGSQSFDPNISLSGRISGTGAVSNQDFDTPLIQGYETSGNCIGDPITAPSLIEIDYLDYINEPPTASNPDPINVQCIDDVPAFDINVVTDEADNSGIPPIVDFVSDVSDNGSCPEIITRTYSVTDDCNNSINVTQTITVQDTIAPVIDNTAEDLDITLECSDAAGITAALALAPTATDNCATPTINLVSDDTTVDPNCPNGYTQVRVWNFTDGCGNTSANFTQTITVQDTIAPVIDNTAEDLDITLECSDAAGITAALALAPTATDNCATPTINLVSDDTTVDPNCPNGYTQVRVWNFTDGCNTSANFTQTITVVDTTAPVIDNTAEDLDITLECSDAAGITAALALAPTATDNCATPTINLVSDDTTVDPSCPNGYTQVRVWNFTDGCNTSANFTQTITVVDTTAPVIDNTTEDLDITLECSDAAGITAALALVPTATDNCATPTINLVSDDTTVDPNCPNGYTQVRVWNFTDGCNTSANFTQTITVVDTTAPVIDNTTEDLDITLECSDTAGITAALALAPTATDNCTTPTINLVSDNTTVDPNCPNGYTQVRVWNFTDGCNTSANFTQTITVVDTTAPVINNTAEDLDITLECSDTAGITAALALAPTATDNCATPTINLVSDDTTVDPNCPNGYTQVRVWNFTDGCNTSANFTQTITVVDTTAPVIDNTAKDIEIECGIGDTQQTLNDWLDANAGATANDNCGTATWTNDYGSDNSVKCDNGAITVTFTATDECGNASITTATYLIKDTTAPVIDNTAKDLDITLECSDAAGITAALTLAPTATDDCSTPTINLVSDDTTVDPNCPNGYTQVRVWNFTDGCGNTSANFTQTITVQDTTAPVIDNTAEDLDITLECSDAAGITAALALAPTATDNCATPTINLVSDDTTVDPNCPNGYTQVRVWNFTDGCNTSANFTQTITVVDTTAPVIDNTTEDLDITLECSDTAGIIAALALAPTATDNCATPTINLVSDDTTVDPNCPNGYTQVRVWNFTDGCNTSANFTQTITVVDTTAPVIDNTTEDLDITLECSDTAGITAALALAPTATDNCATPTINLVSDDTTVDPNCPNGYTQVRVWNFTDGCNTSANFTQTITVVDTTAPVIDNTAEDIEIECGIGDTQQTLNDWLDANAGATANDNCGTATWTNDYGSDNSVKCDNGAITVTFTATDECGNASITTATYLIKDTTAPVIDNTAEDLDITLECSDAAGITAALTLAPTATDDCSTPTINLVSDDTTVDLTVLMDIHKCVVWNFTDGCV